jgi:hypothetical protein
MIRARQPMTITRGIRVSTRGLRRRQSERRMKVVAGLYLIQIVITAGSINTAKRLAASGHFIAPDEQLRQQLHAVAADPAVAAVSLAGALGYCLPVLIGLLFCLAEFRQGGNRAAGTRGILAGLAVAAFSIFWPVIL